MCAPLLQYNRTHPGYPGPLLARPDDDVLRSMEHVVGPWPALQGLPAVPRIPRSPRSPPTSWAPQSPLQVSCLPSTPEQLPRAPVSSLLTCPHPGRLHPWLQLPPDAQSPYACVLGLDCLLQRHRLGAQQHRPLGPPSLSPSNALPSAFVIICPKSYKV